MSENEQNKEVTEENCTHDCSSCEANCSSKTASKEDFYAPLNEYSNVQHVIGVVSGKGGVGKPLYSYLAVLMNRKGFQDSHFRCGITVLPIPKAFGIKDNAERVK